MALAKCPECAGQVSSMAYDCPHCGYPIAQRIEVEYVTPRQAEQLCGGAITAWTWRQYAMQGKVPRQKVSNRVVFRIQDIRDFIEGGEKQWRENPRKQRGCSCVEASGGCDTRTQRESSGESLPARS